MRRAVLDFVLAYRESRGTSGGICSNRSFSLRLRSATQLPISRVVNRAKFRMSGQFGPQTIDPLFLPDVIVESDYKHEFLVIQCFLHSLCRWAFLKCGMRSPRNGRIT